MVIFVYMTKKEYLDENPLLIALPVVTADQQLISNAVGIVGFADEAERTSVFLDIESRTSASVVQALFVATDGNLVELVPFDLADDIQSHPGKVEAEFELFFEIGRKYFPGLLVI